jgi:hypothetical protein
MSQVKSIPLVIVYLNNKLPPYAIENTIYLSKTFPEHEIIIILNIKNNYARLRNLKNVKIYFINSFEKEIASVSEHSKLPHSFRNGFWITTIARFRALEFYMKNYNIERILHLEADVLLLPEFPFHLPVFNSNKLAYPYISKTYASASILYIGSINSLSKLNDFALTQIKLDSNSTDMKILADFGNSQSEYFENLYSGVGHLVGHIPKYIFDAATFGMYLAGHDPRNRRGLFRIYDNIAGHEIFPKSLNFQISAGGQILVSIENNTFVIANLHIHSKSKKYFEVNRSTQRLKRNVNLAKKGPKTYFSLGVFSSMLFHSILRRIGRRH